jgi:iron(III) transport system substrate-binding protein
MHARGMSRRDLLRIAGLGGVASIAAACSQAAPPPTTGGSAPVQTSVPVAATAAAATRPPAAAPASTATQVSAAAPNEKDWDAVVEAARKEGGLIAATYPGTGYRKLMDDFEAAYPGIKVEQTGFQTSGRDFSPRFFQERAAGLYAWDIILMPSTEFFINAIPRGALDPVRPLLVRPDVLDDKNWRGGFESGWLDKNAQYCYGMTRSRSQTLYVDTDQVKDGEISGLQDLLDPKWQGKMIGGDPRTKGSGYWSATAARIKTGSDDIVRRLWKDTQMQLSGDARLLTEAVVRGQFPIGVGAVSKPVLIEFLAQGVGKNVKNIASLELDVVQSSNNVLMYVNRAPHPNVSKVFANWIMGKEGGALIAKYAQDNSRRSDVEVFDSSVVPDQDYVKIDSESYVDEILQTQKIATAILG